MKYSRSWTLIRNCGSFYNEDNNSHNPSLPVGGRKYISCRHRANLKKIEVLYFSISKFNIANFCTSCCPIKSTFLMFDFEIRRFLINWRSTCLSASIKRNIHINAAVVRHHFSAKWVLLLLSVMYICGFECNIYRICSGAACFHNVGLVVFFYLSKESKCFHSLSVITPIHSQCKSQTF